MAKSKSFETTCNDYGSYKGCGQKILLKQTDEPKEDGSGFKWKKFELDGVFPHTHEKKPEAVQGRLTGGAPASNPNANANIVVQENRITVLEKQFATMTTDHEALMLRVAELEKQILKKEAESITNASEDELGGAGDE